MLEARILSMLEAAKEEGLLRRVLAVERRGRLIRADGREVVNFASNDYLGLASDEQVVEAMREAALREGASSTASRLICGDSPQLRSLEENLAALKHRPAALALPSGYHANIAAITTLTTQGDFILSDQNNHASIIDACRLSRATTLIFRHNDAQHLDQLLSQTNADSLRLVVTEGVFSTDGDICALEDITAVVRRHNAVLMVDEAHSTGTLPPRGRGIEEFFNLVGCVDVVMGTLGKALGVHGGFLSGSPALVDMLINYGRTGIYSTALPPPVAAAAAEAAKLLLHKGESLIAELHSNIKLVSRALMERGLINQEPQTPIIAVVVGEERRAVAAREALLERGFLVAALRYPTVPKGAASLRISVSRSHTEQDLVELSSAIAQTLKEIK